MRILALEPYYGGSHAAFLDGWRRHSANAFDVLTMSARKWKWRMRHAALHMVDEIHCIPSGRRDWDVLWCSSMLDLATFRGLCPRAVRETPCVVYFHENQFAYPVQVELERDLHFAYTNMTTALAADAVWFNSAFNRDSMLEELPRFLRRMPDHHPTGVVERIRDRSAIQPPGIDPPHPREQERTPGPPRIAWAARWEHDKNPELFFAALRRLREAGHAFRLSVLGERFERVPEVFAAAQVEFADCIDQWGYLDSREAYLAALAAADVFVSTARHEFFGLSVMEAIAAGCRPVLPRRLVYPELLRELECPVEEFTYPCDQADEAPALAGCLDEVCDDVTRATNRVRSRAALERHGWTTRAAELDDALQRLIASRA